MTTYTTTQGEMWDSIAISAYGSTAYTGMLMMANLPLLDYYTFPAGIEVTIPDITLEKPTTNLPPWKEARG